MIEILIALVCFTALSAWLWSIGDYSFLSIVVAPISTTLGLIGFVIYAVFSWGYFAAGYKVEIINKEFGTHYTQEQLFYASDVIDEIRELKRTRIELNGDLTTGKKL